MISTGVFVALEALPFQIISDFRRLGEGGLEVFYDLKLVRCPRSLAPTLVTLPSMSLIPFAPFGELGEGGWEVFSDFLSDDVGIGKIGAVFEGFVFEPKNVEVGFIVLKGSTRAVKSEDQTPADRRLGCPTPR